METLENKQPAPQPVPPAPPRVRRVGTFTMGVMMILVGLLIAASLMGWGMRLEWVFRLAPLVLVALGIEVLVGACSGGTRLKYDFLSILVCGVLTVAALGFSAVPYLLWYVGPAHDQAERRLEAQVYETVEDSLPAGVLDMLDVSVSLQRPVQDADSAVLQPGDWLHVTAQLAADDEADFLAKVMQVNAALAALDVTDIDVNYTSAPRDDARWELYLADKLLLGADADRLRQNLMVRRNTEYGWLTDEELASIAQNSESQLEEQRVSYEAQLEEQAVSYEAQLQQLRDEYDQQIAALQEQLDAQNAA